MSRALQRFALLSLLTLTAFGLHTLRSVWAETESAALRLQRLREQNAVQAESNAQLSRRVELRGSQTELERTGREQLFLVYPDEKIFIQTGN